METVANIGMKGRDVTVGKEGCERDMGGPFVGVEFHPESKNVGPKQIGQWDTFLILTTIKA